MKTGLVLEGGAMRGMFTAGVLDVLMEHGITVDGAIGVSAGAVFGCNYKSHQIGRTIRYNTEYCKDKRYASFGNLLRTGNLYSEQFCYHTVPEKLDPFDAKTFREDPMDFFVVCTDVRTGDPIYHKCRTGDEGREIRFFCETIDRHLLQLPLLNMRFLFLVREERRFGFGIHAAGGQNREDRPLPAAGRRHCRFHPGALL